MGRIRIIGGQWRGCLLDVPNRPGLRPTPDRVRETLFNWLQYQVSGARCLDAFAGSGALGFEAASRGAASVVMLEQDTSVAAKLAAQAGQFEAAVAVVRADSLKWLRTYAGEGFDLAFLDPPFAAGLLPETLSLLQRPGVLKAEARVYLEWPARETAPPLPQGWESIKTKSAGDVAYALVAVG